MRTLHIYVKQISEVLDDEEDEGVAGVYECQVPGGPEGTQVGQALDTLHLNIGIGCLDDFEITVRDPKTKEILEQDENYEDYSYDDGDVEKISDDVPPDDEVARPPKPKGPGPGFAV